jgi:hypothetical protein
MGMYCRQWLQTKFLGVAAFFLVIRQVLLFASFSFEESSVASSFALSPQWASHDNPTRRGRLRSQIPRYNDLEWANDTHLSRTRSQHLFSDKGVTLESVDSNSCFEKRSIIGLPTSRNVQCLPALYVVGFEKCGTTNLNIWLSYHPNLKTSWFEGRFFDERAKENKKGQEDELWHDYIKTLPKVPKSHREKIWVLEKSPFYSLSPFAPQALSKLVPSARMIFVTRNPTSRAYSMFLMYTRHFPDTTSAILQRPKSYFVKNPRTGDVRYIADGFRDFHPRRQKFPKLPPRAGGTTTRLSCAGHCSGGTLNVKTIELNVTVSEDEWVYLSYPPDPQDFHRFIVRAISKHDPTKIFLQKQGRNQRILTGGLYGPYLDHWRQYFPSQNLIVIPSEEFSHEDNIFDSMDVLQHMLGLPFFDYRTIVKRNTKTNRHEISGSLGTYLNNQINSYGQLSHPMRPETKKLVDDFYCKSNLRLAELLGNRSLPEGYWCGNV